MNAALARVIADDFWAGRPDAGVGRDRFVAALAQQKPDDPSWKELSDILDLGCLMKGNLAWSPSFDHQLYEQKRAPAAVAQECWLQIRLARYTLPAPETINFLDEPAQGHDDFLISFALCAQPLQAILYSASAEKIRPSPSYTDESRY